MVVSSSLSSKQRGFTLMELAIALTIIGLLAAAVTGGLALKHSLEMKKVMDGVSMFAQATQTFTVKYHGLPGDLWDAQTKFGPTMTNGDGDELIEGDERIHAMYQLQAAGLYEGNIDGTWNRDSLPEGPLAGSYYYFDGDLNEDGDATNDGAEGKAIITFSRSSSATDNVYEARSEQFRAILKPKDMKKIDQKYDDAEPNTGKVQVHTGYLDTGGADTSCVATGKYNVAVDEQRCVLSVIVYQTNL